MKKIVDDEFKGWICPRDLSVIIQNRCDCLITSCEVLKDRCLADEHLDFDYLFSHLYKSMFDLDRDINRFLSKR